MIVDRRKEWYQRAAVYLAKRLGWYYEVNDRKIHLWSKCEERTTITCKQFVTQNWQHR